MYGVCGLNLRLSCRLSHQSQSELRDIKLSRRKVSQTHKDIERRWASETDRLTGRRCFFRSIRAGVIQAGSRDTHTQILGVFLVAWCPQTAAEEAFGRQHMVCFSGWWLQLYSGPEVVPAGSLEADLSSEALNNLSWPSQVYCRW